MIDATFVCRVPQVQIDGCDADVIRSGKICGIPPPGTLIETDDGRNGFESDEDCPGIVVLCSSVDPETGKLTVYCEHVGGTVLSAMDLICLDGWECSSTEEDASYREYCEERLYCKTRVSPGPKKVPSQRRRMKALPVSSAAPAS